MDFPGGYTWFHGWRLNISSTHLGHATLWQGMAYKGAFSNLLSTFPRVHQSSIMLPFPRFHSTLKGCFGTIIHGWHELRQLLAPAHWSAHGNHISTFPRVHQCSVGLPFPRFHHTQHGSYGATTQGDNNLGP